MKQKPERVGKPVWLSNKERSLLAELARAEADRIATELTNEPVAVDGPGRERQRVMRLRAKQFLRIALALETPDPDPV